MEVYILDDLFVEVYILADSYIEAYMLDAHHRGGSFTAALSTRKVASGKECCSIQTVEI